MPFKVFEILVLNGIRSKVPRQNNPYLKPLAALHIKKETSFKYHLRTAKFCIHVKDYKHECLHRELLQGFACK